MNFNIDPFSEQDRFLSIIFQGMIAEDIPNWLQDHIDNIHQLGIFGNGNTTKPNHVLINEYNTGQGIENY